MSQPTPSQRPLAEHRYARELEALAAHDEGPRPEGWQLSPRAVSDFIVGRKGSLKHPDGESVEIARKFYGDDHLIERAVITLTTMRGLILIGEPGTAKTMLSELLGAAIGGDTTLAIQGSAGTTEDQIRYGWNYALLLARGPCPEALVPAPLYTAMATGKLVRFEEITRCPPEVQDTIISVLSDRVLVVPELEGPERVLEARPGFNIIATANTRDRGVNEMSAALKRRFNFETVHPIRDIRQELELVRAQTNASLGAQSVPVTLDEDVAELLVSTFHELREGTTQQGERVERPSTLMSTAEAVAVAISSGMHAHYYGDGTIQPAELVRHMVGALLKDDPEDLKRIRTYFEQVVRRRALDNELWMRFYEARRWLK